MDQPKRPDRRHPDELRLSEVAKRVRAARAYAGLSIPELADELGVGAQTIKRVEAGTRRPRRYELWGIADICGLPRWFFEADLASVGPDDLGARVGELERRLRPVAPEPVANGRSRR
jgi:transcriptional regulator with XRE-family HTH domain